MNTEFYTKQIRNMLIYLEKTSITVNNSDVYLGLLTAELQNNILLIKDSTANYVFGDNDYKKIYTSLVPLVKEKAISHLLEHQAKYYLRTAKQIEITT